MCLIAYKEKNGTLTEKQFIAAQTRNSDGTGFMWVENGRVQVEKIVDKDPLKHLALFRKHKDKHSFAFHVRMRTHGTVNEDNCHPYQILTLEEHGMDLWMMHNGVLSGVPQPNKAKSDTWHFAIETLKPILEKNPRLIYDNKAFQSFIHSAIGGGNKLLFMNQDTKKANVLIFNEKAGDYLGGTWFSNLYSINEYRPAYNHNNDYYPRQTQNSCTVPVKPVVELVKPQEIEKPLTTEEAMKKVEETANKMIASTKDLSGRVDANTTEYASDDDEAEDDYQEEVTNAELQAEIFKAADTLWTELDKNPNLKEQDSLCNDFIIKMLDWGDEGVEAFYENEPRLATWLFNHIAESLFKPNEVKVA